MTKLLMTCGAAVLLVACASQPATTGSTMASSATQGSSAAPAASGVQPQQAKLICEDSDQIGSHFHARVCLTPEQAEARKKAAQEMMSNLPGGNGGCANNSCGGPPSN